MIWDNNMFFWTQIIIIIYLIILTFILIFLRIDVNKLNNLFKGDNKK